MSKQCVINERDALKVDVAMLKSKNAALKLENGPRVEMREELRATFIEYEEYCADSKAVYDAKIAAQEAEINKLRKQSSLQQTPVVASMKNAINILKMQILQSEARNEALQHRLLPVSTTNCGTQHQAILISNKHAQSDAHYGYSTLNAPLSDVPSMPSSPSKKRNQKTDSKMHKKVKLDCEVGSAAELIVDELVEVLIHQKDNESLVNVLPIGSRRSSKRIQHTQASSNVGSEMLTSQQDQHGNENEIPVPSSAVDVGDSFVLRGVNVEGNLQTREINKLDILRDLNTTSIAELMNCGVQVVEIINDYYMDDVAKKFPKKDFKPSSKNFFEYECVNGSVNWVEIKGLLDANKKGTNYKFPNSDLMFEICKDKNSKVELRFKNILRLKSAPLKVMGCIVNGRKFVLLMNGT